MKDIQDIESIKIMVDDFYGKVRADGLLSKIFDPVVEDWGKHSLRMYSFWHTVLFGVPDYKGNPFVHHATLQIGTEHFYRWLQLFEETVDHYFEGPKAEEAKKKAEIMAEMFQAKLAKPTAGSHRLI